MAQRKPPENYGYPQAEMLTWTKAGNHGDSLNKPLLLLFQAFGLTLKRRSGFKFALNTAYCCVLLVLIAGAYIWSLCAKFAFVYQICTASIVFLDVSINTTIFVFNTYSVFHAVRISKREQLFHKRIKNVVNILNFKFGRAQLQPSNGKWVYAGIHAIFFVHVVVIQLSYSLFSGFEINKFLLDLQLSFSLYVVLLVVLKIHAINRLIINAFRVLNTETFYHISLNSVLNEKKDRINAREYSVFCLIMKVHSDLMDLMVLTSESYGFHVLLLFLMLVLVTIQGLNLALKSVLEYTPIFKGHQLMSSISVGVLILIFAAFIILIVISCSHASHESVKTSTISSRILPELYHLQHETIFKKMILLFIAYNKYSENRYSALGFIEIDYETILILLECFSLYIVLILQFS